jgi:hypothetical protein
MVCVISGGGTRLDLLNPTSGGFDRITYTLMPPDAGDVLSYVYTCFNGAMVNVPGSWLFQVSDGGQTLVLENPTSEGYITFAKQ